MLLLWPAVWLIVSGERWIAAQLRSTSGSATDVRSPCSVRISAAVPIASTTDAAEVLIRGGVGEHADGGLSAHARDGAGLQLLPAALVRIFVGNGKRQEIEGCFRVALDLEDAGEPASMRRFPFTVVAEARTLDRRALARRTSAATRRTWERRGSPAARAASWQVPGARWQRARGRSCSSPSNSTSTGRSSRGRRSSCQEGGCASRLKLEPVEAVARQGQTGRAARRRAGRACARPARWARCL